jgi:hypothetical protein
MAEKISSGRFMVTPTMTRATAKAFYSATRPAITKKDTHA